MLRSPHHNVPLLVPLWNRASHRGVPIDNFEHKYYHCKCAASQLGVNIVLCHRPAGDGTVEWGRGGGP